MSGKKSILRACLAVCLLGTVLLGCAREQTQPEASEMPTENVEITVETKPRELSVTDLMKAVFTLKDDLESAVELIKEDELDAAAESLAKVQDNTQTVRESLNATVQNLGESAPSLRKELENIQRVLNLVDLAVEKLLLPTIEQMKEYPAAKIAVGDGISTHGLIAYLDYAESLIPDIEEVLACAKAVDLSLWDSDGEIGGYLETADELLDIYRADNTVFDWAKTILGADGDRLYLIVAQNSAEIRASGGFPGSMGTVRIKDGVLTLGKFRSVYQMLSMDVPKGIRLSVEEQRLFSYLSGMAAPRDADFCPDFARVGEIWAAGYETKNKETLSGIISMTPHMVQRILAAMDTQIELFDGSVMNGENATEVLQYDIYFKYSSKNTSSKSNVSMDDLFADAAQKTMEEIVENVSLPMLLKCLSIAKDSFADRTMMMWMNDASEQAMVEQMGWSGSLNKDPQNPQAGVYFSCNIPSKMGIFVDIDTQMGERVQNEDGSYTYPVTVTLTNTMTKAELEKADYYITGGLGGSIRGAAYFFAPAGGTVTDFTSNRGLFVQQAVYQDLQLGFINWITIRPDESVTITYFVTTAPNVETPLVFSQTPTVFGNIQ